MYELPELPLADGPFVPEWHSLEAFRVPQWYQDAKFGIFIHWGPYSVPAFGNEWYSRNMYVKGSAEFEHHLKTWGPQSRFGYKDFIPLLTAERFDAAEWIDLFARAGAKYVVPVAEHHDGFAMYDTALNRWNAKAMGPRRDVIGEIATAARAKGLVFGVSNHRAEHWWFMNGGREFESDVNDPALDKDDYLARLCELTDKYRPQLFYFDTWAERPPLSPYLRAFAAHYYNRGHAWGLPVAINYKNHMFAPRTAVPDVERGQLGDIQPFFWQSDTSVGMKSWGYIDGETYKPAELLIGDLCDIVSKNGTLLLNIGPMADGTIPAEQVAILQRLGDWLAVNGEAIYGTRPWKVYGEGPTAVPEGHFTDAKRVPYTPQDIRFTTRGQKIVYAICLARPDGDVLVRSLGASLRLAPSTPRQVTWLGSDEPVSWRQDEDGLHVAVQSDRGPNQGLVMKLEW
jgi:alpha-L-fucosidase